MNYCVECHKPFTKRTKKQTFCSRECVRLYGGRIGADKIRGKKKEGGNPWMVGENHFRWKGDSVGYFAVHSWLERQRGMPKECEMCGENDENIVYQWANVDHKYRRVVEDYVRMCPKCHHWYDRNILHGRSRKRIAKIKLRRQTYGTHIEA